jgi:hypothetical protein
MSVGVVMELDQVLAFFTESLGGKKVNRPGFRTPQTLRDSFQVQPEMGQLWNSPEIP